jgi:tRNA threonylcarbamoyladenosine biosynthesis protein TsaE
VPLDGKRVDFRHREGFLEKSQVVLSTHVDGIGLFALINKTSRALEIATTSPTFTLMNVYTIHNSQFTIQPTSLVHIDTYRLKNEHELIEIGVEDYLGQPGVVTIIEWPEKIEGLLKDKKITSITLEHLTGDQRKITIT